MQYKPWVRILQPRSVNAVLEQKQELVGGAMALPSEGGSVLVAIGEPRLG